VIFTIESDDGCTRIDPPSVSIRNVPGDVTINVFFDHALDLRRRAQSGNTAKRPINDENKAMNFRGKC